MNTKTLRRQSGFTVVETMITIIVAVLFITMISTLYTAVIRGSSSERNRAEASDLAYAQLRKIVYNGAKPPAGLVCTTIDMTTGATIGQQVASGSLDSDSTAIPQPVTYDVRALAPYGCSGTGTGTPIMIRATIMYGPNNETVVHSAYVGY